MVRVDGTGRDNALIQVRNLNKQYKRGSETIDVLQGLNLDVEAGDFVAFMGPSGSGKTTLLNLLGGLDVPTSGPSLLTAMRSPTCQGRSSPNGGPATSGSSSRCTT